MDAGQIVGIVTALIGAGSALVVAVLGGIFGFITYPRQKAVDRKEELRKERAKAYAEVLAAYAETERWYGVKGQEDIFAEAFLKYSQAYSALFNVADNKVLNPATKFHEFVWVRAPADLDDKQWEEKWRSLYAAMLVEMRDDAFIGQNNVKVNDIVQRLPWYFDWHTEQKARARLA